MNRWLELVTVVLMFFSFMTMGLCVLFRDSLLRLGRPQSSRQADHFATFAALAFFFSVVVLAKWFMINASVIAAWCFP